MQYKSKKYKDPRWQRLRLEVFSRDDFTCRRCTSPADTLHVHHLHYHYDAEPWEYEADELVTVCGDCHKEIHAAANAVRSTVGFIDLASVIELALRITKQNKDNGEGVLVFLEAHYEYLRSEQEAACVR